MRKGVRAPPKPASNYRVGDVLAGKYKLLRALGRGGMCAVWAVQNLVLDAQYAMKLIHNEGDSNAAERMLREARAVARIEHPAIIRMFDFGVTESGDPYLVMELLTGMSLRDRLRAEGPLAPVEAVRLLLPIAEALSVAHAHGVVHRDLKPDNIYCVPAETGRWQPKVIDFGIAKQLDQQLSRLTQAGTTLGSPEYMSPEQALGLPDVDHKTDIWSFSVMLYEAITGATPFFRDGELAGVLQAVVDEPAPAISEFGIKDSELWSILSRGLQKVPSARWNDMRSLGVALAKWLVHHGIEEDVCMQSVRMVWLGGTSASAPPVAMDAREVERARIAALAEPYDVPKRGLFRTTIGFAAAALTLAFIAAGGFYVVRGGVPLSPSRADAVTPLRNSPAPSAGTREDSLAQGPTITAPSPNPPAAPDVTPRVSNSGSLSEPPTPFANPDTGVRSAPAAPRADVRSTRAHEKATLRAHAPAARKKPAKKSDVPVPTEPEKPATTPLPELKPPPDFASPKSDNPYGDGSSTGSKSDNPY